MILMLYYFVPLSTMVQIVKTRNAASIYPPLAITAIANGLMWSIYGFAIMVGEGGAAGWVVCT